MSSTPARAGRFERVWAEVADAECVVISDPADLRWVSGFTGSNGLLILLGDAVHFVTDGRYRDQAGTEVSGAHIHIASGDLLAYAADEILSASPSIAVQADHLTVARHTDLRQRLPNAEWQEVRALLRDLRASKAPSELDWIRKAQAVTEEALLETLGVIRPGISEHEVAAELVGAHLRRGASGMSFEPIVASGPGAALPHARPSNREIQAGELILMDMGCFVGGYASDMTRMVCLGQPNQEGLAVVSHVQTALERSIESARAGLVSRDLDAVARDYLTSVGYGEQFSHSLGHGVGLQIHEWPPVSARSEAVLPEGAVITIEPGVYLSGRFGVRIEDMVVLRADGVERITKLSPELIII